MRTSSALTLLSLCASVLCIASAQSIVLPPAVTFTGAPAYSQTELLSFVGLKPGSVSSQQLVQEAAQHLSDTGLFADIRFQSNPTSLAFVLKPMEADGLLPIHFTNIVIFQPAELLESLKLRVPLFHGLVPVKSNLQDKLTSALQAMLAERNITAQVVALPLGSPGATPTGIALSIASPEVLVHSVAVQPASPAMRSKLDPVLKNLAYKTYEEELTSRSISDQIATAYRNEGYLDIAVTSLTHTPPQITPSAINVDFTAALSEGEPYRISILTWPGSPIFSTADFNKSNKLHPEDIASQQALRQSLGAIAGAYYAKGFQDAKIQAPAVMDRAIHHVAYAINVIPGEQYRVHAIHTVGLTPQQQKDFDAAWRMNQGDFYDISYTRSFLVTRNLPESLRGISATYRAVSDPNTHLVDLTITFVKGGNLIEVR